MPEVDFRVAGAERLENAAKALRGIDTRLVRNMEKRIRREMRPAIQAIRRNARGRLPQRGGLAGSIARSQMRVRVRTGKQADVTLIATSKYDIERLDVDGLVSHPLFGDRSHWYTERVTPGWWSRPIGQRENRMRYTVDQAIEESLNEAFHG